MIRHFVIAGIIIGLFHIPAYAEIPGRYQFIPASPTTAWGYRWDTATGALWRVGLHNAEDPANPLVELLSPSQDVEPIVGRFVVIPQSNQTTFLVDTISGQVWRINSWGQVFNVASPVVDDASMK